jgi:hypothetical protein
MREDLVAAAAPGEGDLMLRFVQMSDEHIMDDDGHAVNGLSVLDPLLPALSSAMRFQDEYSDEVMNRMIATLNDCHGEQPVEQVVATGDNTDLGTVAEVRRFIDNLDGTFDRVSDFEETRRAATGRRRNRSGNLYPSDRPRHRRYSNARPRCRQGSRRQPRLLADRNRIPDRFPAGGAAARDLRARRHRCDPQRGAAT